MDYQNRAGSKKGTGGIASDAQANLSRRKQVEELLRDGEEVPYTFDNNQDEKVRKNPYIYKNHSGKLVCKLCNTMHMSWSSVERHLHGKKHGLNVLRRGSANDKTPTNSGDLQMENNDKKFQNEVELKKQKLKSNGIVPKYKIANVRDRKTGNFGIAIQVDYNTRKENFAKDEKLQTPDETMLFPPFIRIVSGLELPNTDKKNNKFLVIAFEPFENVAIEIPPDKEIIMNECKINPDSVDEFNRQCTSWSADCQILYVQFFFQ